MPKLSRSASKKAKRERMQEEMHSFKAGEMHSGTGRKGEKRKGSVNEDRKSVV